MASHLGSAPQKPGRDPLPTNLPKCKGGLGRKPVFRRRRRRALARSLDWHRSSSHSTKFCRRWIPALRGRLLLLSEWVFHLPREASTPDNRSNVSKQSKSTCHHATSSGSDFRTRRE